MGVERGWADGPWFIARDATASGLAVIEDGRDKGLFPIICEFSEAGLVSVAPDMAEILIEALQRFEGYSVNQLRLIAAGKEFCAEFEPGAAKMALKARAAINKALGENNV